jgi:hypothetical protein
MSNSLELSDDSNGEKKKLVIDKITKVLDNLSNKISK